MYEHNALGYWSGLALCLTKIRSSRARCPATALILSSCLSSVGDLPACSFFSTLCIESFIMKRKRHTLLLFSLGGIIFLHFAI